MVYATSDATSFDTAIWYNFLRYVTLLKHIYKVIFFQCEIHSLINPTWLDI